jgi:hypothetical protein
MVLEYAVDAMIEDDSQSAKSGLRRVLDSDRAPILHQFVRGSVETLRRLRGRFPLMTDHPMFLEYDGTSNSYRSRLGDPSMSIKQRSFETLAATRHALRLVGLRLGAKIDARTGGSNSRNLSPSAPIPPIWGLAQ